MPAPLRIGLVAPSSNVTVETGLGARGSTARARSPGIAGTASHHALPHRRRFPRRRPSPGPDERLDPSLFGNRGISAIRSPTVSRRAAASPPKASGTG